MTSYDQELALATRLENPAWDFIKDVPADDLFASGNPIFTPSSYGRLTDRGGLDMKPYRSYVTGRWSWAIPSPEALGFILATLDGRSVVEVGAGNGYWAWMLAQSGVAVNAYDLHPVGSEHTWFGHREVEKFSDYFGEYEHTEFYPVEQAGSEAVKRPENASRVLFLCWPTMDPWAAECVANFQGDTIIYIGEGPGGCTADSQFFWLVSGSCGCYSDDECLHKALDMPTTFLPTASHSIPQWGGLHDYITVYERTSSWTAAD